MCAILCGAAMWCASVLLGCCVQWSDGTPIESIMSIGRIDPISMHHKFQAHLGTPLFLTEQIEVSNLSNQERTTDLLGNGLYFLNTKQVDACMKVGLGAKDGCLCCNIGVQINLGQSLNSQTQEFSQNSNSHVPSRSVSTILPVDAKRIADKYIISGHIGDSLNILVTNERSLCCDGNVGLLIHNLSLTLSNKEQPGGNEQRSEGGPSLYPVRYLWPVTLGSLFIMLAAVPITLIESLWRSTGWRWLDRGYCGIALLFFGATLFVLAARADVLSGWGF